MNPILRALLGPYGTLIGMGDGRPNNSLSDMQALTKAHAEARAKREAAAAGSLIGPPAPPPPSPPISTHNSGPAPAPAPAAPLGVSMFGPPDAGAPPFQRAINTPPPQPQSF